MFLKYNISNIKREKRLLDISSCDIEKLQDDNKYLLKITTKTPHNLTVGDIIIFNREIMEIDSYVEMRIFLMYGGYDIVRLLKENVYYESGVKKTHPAGYYMLKDNTPVYITDDTEKIHKYLSFNKKLSVLYDNLGKNTFSVIFDEFQELKVSNVLDLDTYGVVFLDGHNSRILKKGDILTLRKKIYCYNFKRIKTDEDNFKEVNVNPNNSTDYIGFDNVVFLGKVYAWGSKIIEIPCEVIDENTFQYSYDDGIFSYGDIIEIEDYSIINKDGELNKGINFYEYNETINITLPISKTCGKGLNDENIINTYFNDKKNEIIPEIVDYEKRCFQPYYKASNSYNFLNKITFNLFFRERISNSTGLDDTDTDTKWVTNDGLGWFQYKINDNGDFVEQENITKGDLLGYLGFNDDDVYYRKKKLSKTFLRLSFYDNNNPLNQMLLFYSTIFLDTGELYNKFIRNLHKKNGEKQLVNDDSLGVDNLTTSFFVYDKYNKKKSSEGFYLYLFPDGLENGQEKTIYMKAEFNHAGYGKTVPLILPNNNKKCLSFSDDKFPISLVEVDNVNLSEFYRQLYIPITIKYKEDTNEFIYYFHYVNEYNNNEIVLNLYEPKIKPLS